MQPARLPEVRCPRCHRLWFKGRLVGEIKCRCKIIVAFDEDGRATKRD